MPRRLPLWYFLNFTLFDAAGSYIYTLTVFDLSGNSASKDINVTVGGEELAEGDEAPGFDLIPILLFSISLLYFRKIRKNKSE